MRALLLDRRQSWAAVHVLVLAAACCMRGRAALSMTCCPGNGPGTRPSATLCPGRAVGCWNTRLSLWRQQPAPSQQHATIALQRAAAFVILLCFYGTESPHPGLLGTDRRQQLTLPTASQPRTCSMVPLVSYVWVCKSCGAIRRLHVKTGKEGRRAIRDSPAGCSAGTAKVARQSTVNRGQSPRTLTMPKCHHSTVDRGQQSEFRTPGKTGERGAGRAIRPGNRWSLTLHVSKDQGTTGGA